MLFLIILTRVWSFQFVARFRTDRFRVVSSIYSYWNFPGCSGADDPARNNKWRRKRAFSAAVPLINEITWQKWLNPNNVQLPMFIKITKLQKWPKEDSALVTRPGGYPLFWQARILEYASRTYSHATRAWHYHGGSAPRWTGLHWYAWRGYDYSLKAISMAFRATNWSRDINKHPQQRSRLVVTAVLTCRTMTSCRASSYGCVYGHVRSASWLLHKFLFTLHGIFMHGLWHQLYL